MKIYCVREKRKTDHFRWFDFFIGAAFGACAGMGWLMLADIL